MAVSGDTQNHLVVEKKKQININRLVSRALISIVVLLYLGISIVSTYHAIDFFNLTNLTWAAVLLALMFELGQMGTLFLIVSKVMQRVNKGVVWALFVLLTGMQVMANVYYAFVHASGYLEWSQLFGIETEPIIFQMRILAIISGGFLPLIGLGFVKSLADYLNPKEKTNDKSVDEDNLEAIFGLNEGVTEGLNEGVTEGVIEEPVINVEETGIQPTTLETNEVVQEPQIEENPEPISEDHKKILNEMMVFTNKNKNEN